MMLLQIWQLGQNNPRSGVIANIYECNYLLSCLSIALQQKAIGQGGPRGHHAALLIAAQTAPGQELEHALVQLQNVEA